MRNYVRNAQIRLRITARNRHHHKSSVRARAEIQSVRSFKSFSLNSGLSRMESPAKHNYHNIGVAVVIIQRRALEIDDLS